MFVDMISVRVGEMAVMKIVNMAVMTCSRLYLILQTASFWRWPVHCRWWSGSDHFFPRNRDGVKECLQRRLAEAPAALMRSLLVVAFDPSIEVVLQIPDRGIGPLSEGDARELVQHCLVEAHSDATRLWALRLGPGMVNIF